MKSRLIAFILLIFLGSAFSAFAQNAEKIYQTERAFEKAAAEKGSNDAFIEFMTPLGVMFVPEAVNAHTFWKNRPRSAAALTWDPVWIDVSSNGAIGYSIGSSVYRAKGKDDPNIVYGHYISIWSRQPDGEYRAVLDTGIQHDKPVSNSVEWRSPVDMGVEKNEAKLSAADSSTGFYQMVDKAGSIKAYKTYLADDAILLRDGKQPFIGKKDAMNFLNSQKPRIRFAKRKAFIEAADMAYVYNIYTLHDPSGTEIERGNFVQVWKLRKGQWQIAADVRVAIPKAAN